MEVGQRITPTRRFDHLSVRIGQVVMQGDHLLVLNGHETPLRKKVQGRCGQRRPARPTRSGSRDDDTRSCGTLSPRARHASVGRVSNVEMAIPITWSYGVLFPSMSTFETVGMGWTLPLSRALHVMLATGFRVTVRPDLPGDWQGAGGASPLR